MTTEQFIVQQLERARIRYRIHGGDIQINCCFKPSRRGNTKLGIKRSSPIGVFYCWSCGAKGSWGSLCRRLGLEPLPGEVIDSTHLAGIANLVHDAFQSDRPPQRNGGVPLDSDEWFGEWRGLPETFLETIGSRMWFDGPPFNVDRIVWPVTINGDAVGATSAVMDPTVVCDAKTRNLPGLDTKGLFFPFDHPLVENSSIIVLVEGQYDALRWLYHGIPAVSIFGTGNWVEGETEKKVSLLVGRGYKVVVLALDGDDEGYVTSRKMETELLRVGLSVRRIAFPKCPPGLVDQWGRPMSCYDPGNVPDRFIERCRQYISSLI